MRVQVHNELVSLLEAWEAGTPVRSIRIGHTVSHDKEPGRYIPHDFDQRRAHDFCFALIAAVVNADTDPSFDLFSMIAAELAPKEISVAELQAATSLAWKAIARGWQQTISQFPAEQQITLAREADA